MKTEKEEVGTLWKKPFETISIFLGLSFSCLRCKVEGLNCVAEEQSAAKAEVERCVWYGYEILGLKSQLPAL